VLDINLDLIWDGGKERNTNAALTIFRHNDSASVVRGFVGEQPKTAWLIDYSLLERIHYLLVAGFDVYGNAAHQLESRLYMDFLRMEGEQNFLMFLPEDQRVALRNYWYRGADAEVKDFVMAADNNQYRRDTNIAFTTDNPKQELLEKLQRHIAGGRNHRYQLSNPHLKRLQTLQGLPFSFMPEMAFLDVLDARGNEHAYTIVRNSAHSNNAQMFDEDKRRLPAEDTLSVVSGFIGSYPNMFFQVPEKELNDFVVSIEKLENEQDYTALVGRYGVRRNASWFWRLSDKFHAMYKKEQPVESGLFDLNRYQNR
jgi:hypothetical protein